MEKFAELLKHNLRAQLGLGVLIFALLAFISSQFLIEPNRQAGETDAESFDTVVYLSPADSAIQNLYSLNFGTQNIQQLTDFAQGVDVVYAISPDANKIAFAMGQTTGADAFDIWLLDIVSDEVIQLTNCVEANASCLEPTWHPNGAFVGYTRRELGEAINNLNRDRAWLVDIETRVSSLLFDDEVIGHSPLWGGAGERVALVSNNPVGIIIYDYATQDVVYIATPQNVIGTFTPDGTAFVYPQLEQGAAGGIFYAQLELINFETQVEIPVSGGRTNPVDDIFARFNPAGTHLGVVRRYLDNRYTNGGQLVVIDMETGQDQDLLYDSQYSHGSIGWNATGTKLVFQRFDYETTAVDIWTIDVATGETQLVVTNGMLPQFLVEK